MLRVLQSSAATATPAAGRIAERLHGELAQLLAMALVHFDHARSDPEAFGRAQVLVQEALRATRTLLRELALSESSVASAPRPDLARQLQHCIEQLHRTHNLAIDFVCDGQPEPLPDAIASALLDGTQELLNNACKHAGPGRVETRLFARPGRLAITVADHGAGLAATRPTWASAPTGLGMPLLRERLAAIGATLRWRIGRGVQARISWRALPSGAPA
ncbi:sensor histidine kinase [Roseateles aquae]|nr:ATP-binding protein [Paucibacter sp. APW11]